MARPKGSATRTSIVPWHRKVFNALTGAHAGNYALYSCRVNGVPSAAIVQIKRHDRAFVVRPMFVAVTDSMTITEQDGTPIEPPDEGAL